GEGETRWETRAAADSDADHRGQPHPDSARQAGRRQGLDHQTVQDRAFGRDRSQAGAGLRMSISNQAVLDSIVVGCTEELFSAYGVRLARRRPTMANREEVIFVGVVGFTSEVMRGALLLAPTCPPLAR